MGLEEELTALARPRRQAPSELKQLLDDARGVCIELAQTLLRKGVQTYPIEVPGEPTSKLKQWLLGPDSNPMVRVADGWEVRQHFHLDTQGSLWQWTYVNWPGDSATALPHPEMRKIDMDGWLATFAKPRNNWVSCGGATFRLKAGDDGRPYLEMSYRYFDGLHEAIVIRGPFREMMIKAAAQLIH